MRTFKAKYVHIGLHQVGPFLGECHNNTDGAAIIEEVEFIEKSAYDDLLRLGLLVDGFSSETIHDEFCGSGRHHPICEQLQKFSAQLKRHYVKDEASK